MLIIYAALAILALYALIRLGDPLTSCRSCAGTGLRRTIGGRIKLCRRCRGTRIRTRGTRAARRGRRAGGGR